MTPEELANRRAEQQRAIAVSKSVRRQRKLDSSQRLTIYRGYQAGTGAVVESMGNEATTHPVITNGLIQSGATLRMRSQWADQMPAPPKLEPVATTTHKKSDMAVALLYSFEEERSVAVECTCPRWQFNSSTYTLDQKCDGSGSYDNLQIGIDTEHQNRIQAVEESNAAKIAQYEAALAAYTDTASYSTPTNAFDLNPYDFFYEGGEVRDAGGRQWFLPDGTPIFYERVDEIPPEFLIYTGFARMRPDNTIHFPGDEIYNPGTGKVNAIFDVIPGLGGQYQWRQLLYEFDNLSPLDLSQTVYGILVADGFYFNLSGDFSKATPRRFILRFIVQDQILSSPPVYPTLEPTPPPPQEKKPSKITQVLYVNSSLVQEVTKDEVFESYLTLLNNKSIELILKLGKETSGEWCKLKKVIILPDKSVESTIFSNPVIPEKDGNNWQEDWAYSYLETAESSNNCANTVKNNSSNVVGKKAFSIDLERVTGELTLSEAIKTKRTLAPLTIVPLRGDGASCKLGVAQDVEIKLPSLADFHSDEVVINPLKTEIIAISAYQK